MLLGGYIMINQKIEGRYQLLVAAIYVVMQFNKGSTAFIQKKLQISYTEAADLMVAMESMGIVSEPNLAGKRQVASIREYNNNCDVSSEDSEIDMIWEKQKIELVKSMLIAFGEIDAEDTEDETSHCDLKQKN